MLEWVLAIQKEHYGPDLLEVAVTLANLGKVYSALGDPQKQEMFLEQGLPIFYMDLIICELLLHW